MRDGCREEGVLNIVAATRRIERGSDGGETSNTREEKLTVRDDDCITTIHRDTKSHETWETKESVRFHFGHYHASRRICLPR